MNPDTPSTNADAPPEHASRLPHGILLLLAILDLGWAAVGLLLTVVILPVLALISLAWILNEPTTHGLAAWWEHMTMLEKVRIVATAVEFLAAPVLNVFLLVGALRLLRARPGALRCIRVWAIGVLVLSAVDLAWITGAWTDPWGWIAVLLVLATPLWAVANLVALTRSAACARVTPVANGTGA